MAFVLALSQAALTYQDKKEADMILTDHQLTHTAFMYQGELKDATGPANGLYDLQFTLYRTQTRGDEVGSVIYENLVLTNGLLSIQLDFGRAVYDQWLEIGVRPAGSTEPYTVLSPRQKLTSTLQAIFARQGAWTLVGMPVGVADSEDFQVVEAEISSDGPRPTEQKAKNTSTPSVDDPDGNPSDATPSQLGDWTLTGNRGTDPTRNFLGTADNVALVFRTNLMERMRIDNLGNVGIGTMSPGFLLDVAGTARLRGGAGATGLLVNSSGNVGIGTANPTGRVHSVGAWPTASLLLEDTALTYTSIAHAPADNGIGFLTASGGAANVNVGGLSITSSYFTAPPASGLYVQGNVGIGTMTPGAKLDVAGSLRANGDTRLFKGITSPTFTLATLQVEHGPNQGEAAWLRTASASTTNAVLKLVRHPNSSNNFMDGTTSTGPGGSETRRFHINSAGSFVAGSDFAEVFPAKGGKASYQPGDVLVLSADQPRAVEKSDRAYDIKVAGIYSTRPAVLGAEKDGETRVDPDDIPVAIVGIVPTKVTAENGPIQPGDLLATSNTPGYAMKASPVIVNGIELYPTGTILGKALEPLEDGTGIIKVLVMLR
ncbi:MAG: hypothetical protein HY314_16400 [Acidobacteria bacterium]|nr:hypothetical protein [Acidobacteriota bacterium]